jgi:hypothetical protein
MNKRNSKSEDMLLGSGAILSHKRSAIVQVRRLKDACTESDDCKSDASSEHPLGIEFESFDKPADRAGKDWRICDLGEGV